MSTIAVKISMMKKRILTPLLLLTILCLAQNKQYNNNVLKYKGDFNYGNYTTDLQVEIHQHTSHPKIFFSSIGQNAFQIPARKILIDQDSLQFVLQSDYFTYQFKGAFVKNVLNLNLQVDTVSHDFKLIKTQAKDEISKHKKDIHFISQGLKLYGTIWHPTQSNGKAIYFVTSSGNNDRSSSRAEAILFAQQGFTTFHIDKRGTGQSEGSWQVVSMEALCADDIAAIQYLIRTTKIPMSAIGIKGSSQGAAKVPYILNQLKDLSFGIAVSCPGSTLLESDINYWKNRHINTIDESDINEATALQKMIYEHIAGITDRKTLEVVLDQNKHKSWFSQIWIPSLEEVQIDKKLIFSPIPYFEKINQPLLLIQGTADQIIPENSHKIIFQALNKNSNPNNQIIILENADHSMYDQGQSDFPYWSALHEDYLSTMFTWINEYKK